MPSDMHHMPERRPNIGGYSWRSGFEYMNHTDSPAEAAASISASERQRSSRPASSPLPLALIGAVLIDSATDGLLLGLAAVSSSRPNAGLVLSFALSIEMGFLGMAYASSLRDKLPGTAGFVAVCIPPVTLLSASIVGGCVAAPLARGYPKLHLGLVAFGTAALIYLITEELLIEAHQRSRDHTWWIDLMFFVGFLSSFLLERCINYQ